MKQIVRWTLLSVIGIFVVIGCGVNDFPDGNTTQPSTQDGTPGNETNTTLAKTLRIIDPSAKILQVSKPGAEYAVVLNVAENGLGVSGERVEVVTLPRQGSFFSNTSTSGAQGDAAFVYQSPQALQTQSFDVRFCLQSSPDICETLTIAINADSNTTQPPTDQNGTDVGNDKINYAQSFLLDGGENTLGLGEKKLLRVALIDKDTGEAVPDGQIKSITIRSGSPGIVTLIDKNDPLGEAKASTTIMQRNNVELWVKASEEHSGLSDITVEIAYKNTLGYDRNSTQTYAVTVLSGPPTAFSIVDGGTSYNPDTKHFQQKFVITASDKYNNKINTSPTISVSVMAGYATDANGNRMVYGQNSAAAGIYGNFDKGLPPTLTSVGVAPFVPFDTQSLTGIDLDRDVVALFGNVRTYEMNGKWEIDQILSPSQISFKDEYDGESYEKIGFAIGHNYRRDRCSDEYREYEVKVDSTDGTYKFDENGYAFVTIDYPAEYMPGKKVALMVNFIGLNPETKKQLRSGEVRFETLYVRAPWFLEGLSVTVKAGETKRILHRGVVTTDTGDRFNLVGSSFMCSVSESSGVGIRLLAYNDPNQTDRSALCDTQLVEGFLVNNHQSYLIFEVTAGAEDGTFVLSNCKPVDEFRF